MELQALGSLNQNTLMALAGRILAAAATDPDVDWSIEAMCEKTGLDRIEVIAIYQQSWFTAMLQEQAMKKSARLATRALQVMEDLLNDEEQLPRLRLDAANAVLRGYKILVDAAPLQNSEGAKDASKKAVEQVKMAAATVIDAQQKVKDEGSRPLDLGDAPAPTKRNDRRGRSD